MTLSLLRPIDVHQLLLDVENPRLPAHSPDQPGTIQAMARSQGNHLVGMAEHLLEFGPSPADLPIVMPSPDKSAYIVLDGNRRLTAIKALENPSLVEGAVPTSLFKKITALSKRYQTDPVSQLTCYVVSSRQEADPWIRNRHRGLRGGSGLHEWDGYVAARYDSISGEKSIGLQVLDFTQEHASLSSQTLERIRSGKFPITTLERVVRTPYVRQRLGFDIKKGKLLTNLPPSEVVKGLARIVEDVGSGERTVSDVKQEKQRKEYVDEFPPEDRPDLSKAESELRPVDEQPAPSRKKRQRHSAKPRPRPTLVPTDFVLRVDHPRVAAIADELGSLHVDKFPNAAAVIFRVFLELSLDHFLEVRVGWKEQQVVGSTLSHKLTSAANHLERAGVLSSQQLAPVKKAAAGQTLLVAGVKTLHGYVHNRHFSPIPSELRTAWNDLQPFITELWPEP